MDVLATNQVFLYARVVQSTSKQASTVILDYNRVVNCVFERDIRSIPVAADVSDECNTKPISSAFW